MYDCEGSLVKKVTTTGTDECLYKALRCGYAFTTCT